MPRRNRKAGQPNREAQKNLRAYRVVAKERFKVNLKDEDEEVGYAETVRDVR